MHQVNPNTFVGFGWAILWIAFVLILVVLKRRERMHIYDLTEKAAKEGRTLPPEVFQRLLRRPRNWVSDLRVGLILVAVAVGLAMGGAINYYDYPGPHPQLFYGPFKLFPVPLMLGVAFLLMGWLRRGEDRDR